MRNTFAVRTSLTLKLRSSAECSHGALVRSHLLNQRLIHPLLLRFPRPNALVLFYFTVLVECSVVLSDAD